MIALWILLAVLILLLATPLGLAASFSKDILSLSLVLGPAKIRLLPKKEKPSPAKSKESKGRDKEKKAAKETKPGKEKQKLSKDEILEILRMALKAVGRFFRKLKLDELVVHITIASADPYDTVMLYGYCNAALGALLPLLHNAFRVGREDIGAAMDFQLEKTELEAKLQATLRLGEILWIVLCAGAVFLGFYLRRKKRSKREKNNIVTEKGI